jgi:exopolysaccharide biosynthesis polyprenyl glycosylphosphotransferase
MVSLPRRKQVHLDPAMRKWLWRGVEALTLTACFLVLSAIPFAVGPAAAPRWSWPLVCLGALAALVLELSLLASTGAAATEPPQRGDPALPRALGSALVAGGLGLLAIVCAAAWLAPPNTSALRDQLLGARLVAGVAGSALALVALRGPRVQEALDRALRPRVLLVGDGALARAVARTIAEDGQHLLVGPYAPDSPPVSEALRQRTVQTVVVAVDDRRGLPLEALLEFRLGGGTVEEAPHFSERTLGRLPAELLRPADLIFTDGFSLPVWKRAAKRALSVAGALMLLVVTLPLVLLCALLVRLDSRGPLLYVQERVGLGGRTFRMFKFRTMCVDAEQLGRAEWARRSDPRVTRVGRWLRRFRIDELPQLLNVLRGEMHLIGPRPERPQFVEELRQKLPWYDLRHRVPPGITGWAQVRYPYAASLEESREKLQYDLYYVKRPSLVLDLAILVETVRVVLQGRGAR